mmetsp:Transcript_39743/g.72736  ORF Transcript_39743/g.72736 Transcript_39743/m.72736 type:complete len:91 (-) Transcript_39743:14-286(-)
MTREEHCRGAKAFDVGVIIVMVAMMDAAITYLLAVIILLFVCCIIFAPWRGMHYLICAATTTEVELVMNRSEQRICKCVYRQSQNTSVNV